MGHGKIKVGAGNTRQATPSGVVRCWKPTPGARRRPGKTQQVVKQGSDPLITDLGDDFLQRQAAGKADW